MTKFFIKRGVLLLAVISSVCATAQTAEGVASFGGEIDGVRKYRELRSDVDSALWDKNLNFEESYVNDDKNSFTFSEGQLDDDEDVIQGSSAMTTSNDDYFLSEVGYLFSSMRFRVRAYENQYNNVYANGVC